MAGDAAILVGDGEGQQQPAEDDVLIRPDRVDGGDVLKEQVGPATPGAHAGQECRPTLRHF
jgi:hypothetical protein